MLEIEQYNESEMKGNNKQLEVIFMKPTIFFWLAKVTIKPNNTAHGLSKGNKREEK